MLKIEEKVEYQGKKYSHILPLKNVNLNFLDQVKIPSNIKLHKCARHLNSSQVMCINFFEPLTNDDEGRDLLHKILYFSLGEKLPKNGKIVETEFEKVLDSKEETNFDFYVKYSSGEQIFFEIKYTEYKFGKTSPDLDKYDRKWKDTHEKHLQESLYLKNCGKETFYKDYQINRNISYLRSEKDETFSFSDRLIFPCFWNDMLHNALIYTKETKYFKHYLEFGSKYCPNNKK